MQIWSVSILGHFVRFVLLLSLHLCKKQGVFSPRRHHQRHKLVVFSAPGCVQINRTMIGCQNGKSCKLSMRIWICLCHCACGAFRETIGVAAKKQSRVESRLQSKDCSIVFYQAGVVFSSTETTFFDFFPIFQEEWRHCFPCPAPLDTNCFGRGKLVWKLCCLLFKEKHAYRREGRVRDILWARVPIESVMKCSA